MLPLKMKGKPLSSKHMINPLLCCWIVCLVVCRASDGSHSNTDTCQLILLMENSFFKMDHLMGL